MLTIVTLGGDLMARISFSYLMLTIVLQYHMVFNANYRRNPYNINEGNIHPHESEQSWTQKILASPLGPYCKSVPHMPQDDAILNLQVQAKALFSFFELPVQVKALVFWELQVQVKALSPKKKKIKKSSYVHSEPNVRLTSSFSFLILNVHVLLVDKMVPKN